MKEQKEKKDLIKHYEDESYFGPGMEIKKVRNKEPKDGFLAKQAWKKKSSHREEEP